MTASYLVSIETAYTATNARKTDAGDYEVEVTLADPINYRWSDGGAAEYDGGTWHITAKQITPPTVQAESIIYDGETYDGEVSISQHSTTSEGVLELSGNLADHTYYRGVTALEGPPTQAGSYTLVPEFVFAEGLNPKNYNVNLSSAVSFEI